MLQPGKSLQASSLHLMTLSLRGKKRDAGSPVGNCEALYPVTALRRFSSNSNFRAIRQTGLLLWPIYYESIKHDKVMTSYKVYSANVFNNFSPAP